MRNLTVLLVLLAAQAFAQTKGDAEAKLVAMENAWNAAQRDHDAKALEALVGDNFINTDWDGSVQDKAEFLKSIKDPSVKYTSMNNDNVAVFMYGNTAVVAGAYHLKGTKSGKPYQAHGRFTDTWIQSNGKWQCVASSSQHNAK